MDGRCGRGPCSSVERRVFEGIAHRGRVRKCRENINAGRSMCGCQSEDRNEVANEGLKGTVEVTDVWICKQAVWRNGCKCEMVTAKCDLSVTRLGRGRSEMQEMLCKSC